MLTQVAKSTPNGSTLQSQLFDGVSGLVGKGHQVAKRNLWIGFDPGSMVTR